MMLSDIDLIARLKSPSEGSSGREPLIITPLLNSNASSGISDGGAIHGCSIDLRLGTWFEVTRPHTHATREILEPGESASGVDERPGKTIYVPYGRKFFLHPGNFVLGVTLEWIRMPPDLVGAVRGKSQWTRRGLTVATSTMVHPWFVGCLTLELANIGEHPVVLSPGMPICQMAVESLSSNASLPLKASPLIGHRRAVHTDIRRDDRALALAKER